MKKKRNYQLILDTIFTILFAIMAAYDAFVTHDYSNALSNFLISVLLLRITQYEKQIDNYANKI